jgi:hypothetical protein
MSLSEKAVNRSRPLNTGIIQGPGLYPGRCGKVEGGLFFSHPYIWCNPPSPRGDWFWMMRVRIISIAMAIAISMGKNEL